MKTLHIIPGDSAAGSLMKALQDAGRDDEVLRWMDDLSCGPINPGDPSARAEWWASLQENRDVESTLKAFWRRADTTAVRRVVWFGRHSALELSFFLSWVDRLGAEPFEVVDVTGLKLPFTKKDGSDAITQPAASVGTVPTSGLKTLFDKARPISPHERNEAKERWTKLKTENAPLRVVTADGLTSAPIEYFDQILKEHVTSEWQSMLRIVARTTIGASETYYQVGARFLQSRLVALIGKGTLLAEGNPADMDMRNCRVRLPG